MDLEKLRPLFWEKVERVPGVDCWLWIGALKNKYGHGVMGMGLSKATNKLIASHRLSYLLNVGPIPEGLHVLHKCDNQNCCNPEHLYLGTHQDNMRDARARGQLGKGRNSGVKNGNRVKLTDEKVVAILADKRRAAVVAAEYGVSIKTIYNIHCGYRWAHLQEKGNV